MARRMIIPVPLRCPVDGSLLHAKGKGHLGFEHCGICGGVWLSSPARKRIFSDQPDLRTQLDELLRSQFANAQPSSKRCATCKETHLTICQFGGTELDTCPKCMGLWLDKGELESLKRRRRTLGDAGFAVGDAALGTLFEALLNAIF